MVDRNIIKIFFKNRIIILKALIGIDYFYKKQIFHIKLFFYFRQKFTCVKYSYKSCSKFKNYINKEKIMWK